MGAVPLGGVLRHGLLACGYWLLGLLVGGIAVLLHVVDAMPDLAVWHDVEFESEFNSQRSDITTLGDYLALEEQLFEELEQRVYAAVDADTVQGIQRFRSGSRVDPTHYDVNWNRTRELPVSRPRAGVLLLHGLSDSPYSLRQLALSLQQSQVHSVLLRLPGHGTAPSGLLTATATDFKAAVRLGARHVRERIGPEAPLYIVGYSNGAALAVEYALSVLEGEALPSVSGLILISPAIGVSPLAALAPWQRRVSYLPGLDKLAWQSVQPEYDPFKYNSFPLNAAEQVYGLTQDVALRLNRLELASGLQRFPPTLAFSSVVDATVSVDSLVEVLMMKLHSGANRLVMYDVNQEANTAFLFSDATRLAAEGWLARSMPFDLEILSNGPTDSSQLARITKAAQSDQFEIAATALEWPRELYSLSHVALPFAVNDPAYGDVPQIDGQPASFGNVVLRGERGVLQVPINQLMRLRYNPFYEYQQQQILGLVLGAKGP